MDGGVTTVDLTAKCRLEPTKVVRKSFSQSASDCSPAGSGWVKRKARDRRGPIVLQHSNGDDNVDGGDSGEVTKVGCSPVQTVADSELHCGTVDSYQLFAAA